LASHQWWWGLLGWEVKIVHLRLNNGFLLVRLQRRSHFFWFFWQLGTGLLIYGLALKNWSLLFYNTRSHSAKRVRLNQLSRLYYLSSRYSLTFCLVRWFLTGWLLRFLNTRFMSRRVAQQSLVKDRPELLCILVVSLQLLWIKHHLNIFLSECLIFFVIFICLRHSRAYLWKSLIEITGFCLKLL
jgi:hypothetical protein